MTESELIILCVALATMSSIIVYLTVPLRATEKVPIE